MSKRLSVLPILLIVACGSQPPRSQPVTPATSPTTETDTAVASENEKLRASVTELESRLIEVTEARDSAVAMNIEVSTELDKAQSALAAARKTAEPPTRPVPGVRYSIPLNDGVVDGKDNALVTIVVATEAACPFCWRAEDTLELLRKEYKKDLRIVYQSRIVHPVAKEPAAAMCAADKQKKGVKMWSAIRDRYQDYTAGNRNAFARAELVAAAKKLRIKIGRFEKDMDGSCRDLVEKQNSFFTSMGVNGTPTFFINGMVISGAQRPEAFRTVIDAELDAARAMVADGIDRRSLYAAIVSFGKKRL